MTVAEIKTLPRTEEGIFDVSSLGSNPYKAALMVYPAYTEFETKENKKEGYPDIMEQMRVWNRKANDDFTMETAADYLEMLYATIEKMSPEIYENYRELVDMFRAGVKRALAEYYSAETGFAGDGDAVRTFCNAVQSACKMDILLAEKYEMCF